MKPEFPDYIIVGEVVRAHGVRGGVKVKPISDFPHRFSQLKKVVVEMPRGPTTELEIVSAAVRKNFVFLTLSGIDSREKAQALQGGFLKIPSAQAAPLADDEFYHFEVIGFEVQTTAAQSLGLVEEVLALPANDVLVVQANEREYLIPVIKDVIKKIDRPARRITIEAIAGLLD